MRFSIAADIDLMAVLMAAKRHEEHLRLLGGNPPTLVYFDKRNTPAEELIKGSVSVMTAVVKDFEELAEAAKTAKAPAGKSGTI